MAILKRGLAGEPVKRLQKKLGIEADGQFGLATEQKLKDYQEKHGLPADGIAGPDTFAQMGLHELILLRVGTSGQAVKRLQAALEIQADGHYGSGTERAVREYQRKQSLVADGIAGPATLAKLGVFSEITPAVIAQSTVPVGSDAARPGGPDHKSVWDTIKTMFSGR